MRIKRGTVSINDPLVEKKGGGWIESYENDLWRRKEKIMNDW